MNVAKPLGAVRRLLHVLFLQCRTYLPRQRCLAFSSQSSGGRFRIGPIFVINLDRQSDRWNEVLRELDRVRDADGKPLSKRVVRYSAFDARNGTQQLLADGSIDRYYTLEDQLFVEPQPSALPDQFDLARRIAMSEAEVAVARSHIGVWKVIADSDAPYALVLEDDVWVERAFGRILDRAWQEVEADSGSAFDILYVSYKEARYGAPKELVSKNVFRPERGLWYLSGYVLSKRGARALLGLLPCRGPVDLWVNHKFKEVQVLAVRRSVINQRLDTLSTNSHSILPALTKIGILDYGEAALFRQRPTLTPVFAFGAHSSALSSLAMALSMLGYRCCSDLDRLPEHELEQLFGGGARRLFNAYVNINSLSAHAHVLVRRFPHAKFFVIDDEEGEASQSWHQVLDALNGADVVHLHGDHAKSWRLLCEHLRLAPPVAPYPIVRGVGPRRYQAAATENSEVRSAKHLRHDPSPWVIEPRAGWTGIRASTSDRSDPKGSPLIFDDDLTCVQATRWLLRNDTFPGNLALFRPGNVTVQSDGGLSLAVFQEPLGVRDFSAAGISSRSLFLYGRFEATLRATDVPGLVTGLFLHRNSPRQEIDVEIAGNRPSRLLVNVYYNPGTEGAKYDYGYRGTPAVIPLWFDASKAFHRFAIEWDPSEIRWFVDGELVHRRAAWNPTPIPHLPMTLHVNTWPSRSRELAGRLSPRALPASASVRRIAVDAFDGGAETSVV